MSVLVPQGVAPEFTKSQDKDTKFSNVSSIWTSQCLTYDQVMQDIESAMRSREDIECPLSDMKTSVSNGKLVFVYKDGREFVPTDHALSQYATYLGTSTFFVCEMRKNRKLDASTMIIRDAQDADVLNQVLNNSRRRRTETVERKFRTYNDGTMRAFLSDSYTYIDNRWYLEALKEIIPDGLVSHWRGDEDHFNANILIPDTIMNKPDGDSDYGGMVSAKNNEIGAGRNEQMPSIFRAICMNGCIWGQTKGEKQSKVHRGKIDYTAFAKDMYDNITKQIPLFTVRIEQFLSTMNLEVKDCNMAQVIAQAAVEHKFTTEEAGETIKLYNQFESSHRNLFGLINGITRAAQVTDPYKLDTVGGKLVMMSKDNWSGFLRKAREIKDEQLQEIFGIVA